MDDRDDPKAPGEDQAETATPPEGPARGRPRIAGVEAGVAAGLFPSTSAPGDDRPIEPEGRPVPLPDWTDPPTREVPRVLLDETGVQRAVSGPVWREVEEDWGQDDLFADMVTEAQSRAASELDEDPWREPPSRPAAGLVSTSAGSGWEEEAPGRPPSEPVEQVAFEDEQHGLRARVAWAGRAGRRRHVEAESTQAIPALGAHAATPRPSSEVESGSGGAAAGTGRRSPVVATATGVAVGVVALACFKAGPAATLGLVCAVLIAATAECYQALRRARYRPAVLLGLVAAPVGAIAAYTKGTTGLVVVGAALVVLSFGWFLAGMSRKSPVANLGATLLGWAWVGFLGGFAGLLVSPSAFGHRTGIAYLLGAIEVTVAYDVGAYAIGSWLGRHKLAPTVSPNKTWEGLAGGWAAALLVAVVLTSHMHPWNLPRALALGLVVVVVAPIGDLAESLVKRDLHLKDMGSLLPSHGGLLDRIDALLFVLPAVYVLARLFHV